MSDILAPLRGNLVEAATDLDITSYAAMEGLGLKENEFSWFNGDARYAMEPQAISTDSARWAKLFLGSYQPILHDSYSSNVTYYGGRIANEAGRFACGHIQAHISEPIPEGAKHQSGDLELPVPYIPRILEFNRGIFTVGTPTKHGNPSEGPVVVEGNGRNPRFRKTTVYNINTGDISVRHGQFITDGHGWSIDKTKLSDISELDEEVATQRLATMVRTLRAATYIFGQIASRDTSHVTWKVIK